MRGGAGGVRHPDPAPVQRAGPAGGVLFRQGPARSTAPRAADDAVDRHRHQPAPPLRPSGTGERAGDRDEELRQDPAGVGVRCRPPPRPRARRSRTAVAERSVNVTCPSCETVYRVDPAKVPPGGVRARCAVCSNVFPVSPHAAAAAPAAPRPAGPAVAATRPAPFASARPPAPPAPPAPPTPPAPPRPSPQPPVAPAAGATPAQRMTGPLRPVNPFMVQDPKQKARRLARALVSDLVVYHPEKRQQGLRDGTLPQLFKDEIEKSWQEYVEQVGQEVAKSTPFWAEALNEILAGGNKVF